MLRASKDINMEHSHHNFQKDQARWPIRQHTGAYGVQVLIGRPAQQVFSIWKMRHDFLEEYER
jgi:hypothetical protein